MTSVSSIFLAVSMLVFSSVGHALVGDLNLKITNLRSNKGSLLLSVFDKADGFPGDPNKAFKLVRVSAKDAERITIQDLEYGVYSISMVHDENDNGELDTGAFGIPKEGIGFSQNPKVTFGPPKFNEAAFTFQSPLVNTFIEVKYF